MITLILSLSLLAGAPAAPAAHQVNAAVEQVHHGKGWVQAEDGSWVRPSFYKSNRSK